MNKEQQELLDEAYKNWIVNVKKNVDKETLDKFINHTPNLHKAEFINKCKTDTEFSEKWGLKIEERELSRDERIDLYCKEYTGGTKGKYEPPFDDFIDAKLTTRDIPTRLITITYNGKTIESYE